MRRLAVVIAARDERGNVVELAGRLRRTLAGLDGLEYEIIFVVAGSDGTAELLDCTPGVRVLRQTGADGLAAAFRQGFAAVAPSTDAVATMDADLNHQPEELPRLLATLESAAADIVVGSRSVPGAAIRGAAAWKRALSRIGNGVVRILFGSGVSDRSSGYRVYRRAALARLRVAGSGFAFLPAMLLEAEQLGLRIFEEPITFVQRIWGRSKLPLVATAIGYMRIASRHRVALGDRRQREMDREGRP